MFRPQTHLSGHAHTFPPGDRNLQDFSIVREGLELKNSNLKTNMLGFAAHALKQIDVRKIIVPYVKKQGLTNTQFGNEIASELWIR